MKNYTIAFIDGHDLKYKVIETAATDETAATNELYRRYGYNFDHAIISITEKKPALDSMCLDCVKLNNICKGSYNNIYSGCIYKRKKYA